MSIPLHHLPLLPLPGLSRIEVRLYHHPFSCCIFSRITQLHNHYLNVAFAVTAVPRCTLSMTCIDP